MSYAELLQAWRTGALPGRDLAGRDREALRTINDGALPVIPALPEQKTEGEGMPSPEQLQALCRRAVADYPTIPAERLRRFLEVAEDPEWCSERIARLLARRMAEGLVTWEPGQ